MYQKQLLACCDAIIDKLDCDADNTTTGYSLFKVIATLLALKHEENTEIRIDCGVLDKLAAVLNCTTDELWLRYTNDLLNHVNNEPKSWTCVNDSACIFQLILCECGPTLGGNLPLIASILVEALDCSVDAELRLKIFCILANCFENKEITFKHAQNVNEFLNQLIIGVFVPSLVWHAGATAETIRTMTAACLKCALLPPYNLFTCPETLRDLIEQLLPLLLSLVEDASFRSRQLAVECLVSLKEHGETLEVFTLEDFVRIYPGK